MANATLTPRRSQLTKGRMPSYTLWVVLAASIVVGAALAALVGFSLVPFALFSALIFIGAGTAVTGVVEG